jgi:hypothetical protein
MVWGRPGAAPLAEKRESVSTWKKSTAIIPCLGGQELSPGRAGTARCWVDAVGVQGVPDGGGADAVAVYAARSV